MLETKINELDNLYNSLNKKDNLMKIHSYYKNKYYIVVFIKQIEALITNIKSIKALIEIGNIQDAFTIFRKYLETYFILFSIYENTDLVDKYMEHDSMLGKKECDGRNNDVRKFIKNKPLNYLEYGYLESKLNIASDSKYTLYEVAEQANLLNFHKWYKLCNNFVHNNLTSVNIDEKEGKSKLIEYCYESINYLIFHINTILN